MKSKVCYFCGAKATSKEHAPPKQMFRAFSCDSITVPSCDVHNHDKGRHDQAIVAAFLIPLDNGVKLSGWNLEPEVALALNTGRSSFQLAKRKAASANLVSDIPMPDVSFLSVDIRPWLRQLTAALVFDKTQTFDPKINWSGAIAWSAEWLEAKSSIPKPASEVQEELRLRAIIKKGFEKLTWKPGWSANPRSYPSNIYRFQYRINGREVFFKHTFYNRYTWYVTFKASRQTVAALQK